MMKPVFEKAVVHAIEMLEHKFQMPIGQSDETSGATIFFNKGMRLIAGC
jgi:sialic acid synthase SpsE